VEGLTFVRAGEDDFEALVTLRIAAMRESLERIGRFDPGRARQRLRDTFDPDFTYFVLWHGERVGFYALHLDLDAFHLQHLYIHPDYQGQGIGSAVLRHVIPQAGFDPIYVGALRGSDANRFYLRHGFKPDYEEEWDIYYVRDPAPIF